jgi:hypothetical protein
VDRCALFVDAGYLLADGAMAVHGTRHRESVSWNYAGLLQFLGSAARERTGLPLLRCYWYEATVEGRRSAEHDALADLPGVKLRLGRMRPGRREGVESEIHRDLTTLARNGALQDALVVSAEEDLAQVIADVQDLGLRVTLIHITVDGNWTISRALRQECDDVVEVNEAHLRPYVELVVGAEPLRDDERHAVGAHSGRPLTNGHGHAGPLGQQQALPAGSHPAPPEIYTGPVIAEYQRTAQPAMNGQPGPPQPASASGPSAPAGMTPPGPQAGQPQAQVPQPGQPQALQPGQPQAPQPGQPPMPRRRQPRTTAPAPAGSTQQGMVVMEPPPGVPTQPAMPAAQQPMPAQPEPVIPAAQQAAPTAQPAPAPGPEAGNSRAMAQRGAPQQAMPQQGLHGLPQQAVSQSVPQQGVPPAAAPGMAGQPGPQPPAPLPQRTPTSAAAPRTQNSGAAPAAASMPPASQPGPQGPPGPMGQHPASGQPGMPPSPAQHGHPGTAPHQTAPHQTAPPGVSAGQPGYPAPPAYQGPGPGAPPAPAGPGGPGTPGRPGAAAAPGNGPGEQGQTDPLQAIAGPQPAPALAALPDPAMGQAGPAGPALPPGGGVPPGPGGPAGPVAPSPQAPGAPQGYPAPARTGRFARGSQDQRAAQQFPGPPADQPEATAGAAYSPQQGPYGGPQPASSHPPVAQQTSISLPDAVQAAHDEGFTFGQSVAHEAPALWLEAVLARKPRMPSDLEARLLQDSALPIDSLLHDEVRHALRRGFWDALERARS